MNVAQKVLETWSLSRGGTVLGRIRVTGLDQPWLSGEWLPEPAFDAVAPLFEQELALLNADRMDEWEAAYAAIDALGLRLRREDTGETCSEFILHVDGREAWFRY